MQRPGFSDADRTQLHTLLREAERLSALAAGGQESALHTNWALAAYRISRLVIRAEEALGEEELTRLQAEIDPDLDGLWNKYRRNRWRISPVKDQIVLHLGPSISGSVAVTLSPIGEISGITPTYTCSQLWEHDVLTKGTVSDCCPICHGSGHPGEEDSSMQLLFTPGGACSCCAAKLTGPSTRRDSTNCSQPWSASLNKTALTALKHGGATATLRSSVP